MLVYEVSICLTFISYIGDSYVVARFPDQDVMRQVDVQSSLLAFIVLVAVALDEHMLIDPVVGRRFGLTFDAKAVSRLVEGLKDRRHCASESVRSLFDLAVALAVGDIAVWLGKMDCVGNELVGLFVCSDLNTDTDGAAYSGLYTHVRDERLQRLGSGVAHRRAERLNFCISGGDSH
jgi:hypothetical protein